MNQDEYRAGLMVHEPQFRVIPAPSQPNFDDSNGVGDADNGHALIELTEQCWWRDQKRLVAIDVGFVCDGASVPNGVYGLLDANAIDLVLPGLIHDYLYRQGAIMRNPATMEPREFDRHDADKVLSKVAQMVGCDWDDAKKIYYGVRVGGSGSYQQKPVGWYPS